MVELHGHRVLLPHSAAQCEAAREPAVPGWIGIVANANSGLGRGMKRVDGLVAALKDAGLSVDVAWSPAERQSLVRRAREGAGCQALIAVGGDGTVSALVNERPGCPIAAVPAGTENLFARHFHFNGSPDRLVNALVRGESRDVDLGCAQGRLFTLMAGFGFDADIVSRHHAARVRSNGDAGPTSRAAYMEPILKASVHYRFPEIQVAIDAPEELGQISGTSVLVFNLPRYALGLPFAPSARDDDGYLDLVVFRKPGPWNALRYLWLVFRRLHLARRGIIHKRVRRVRISASSAVPIQLDGDPAGELQPGVENAWTLEAVPGGLRVVSIRKRKHNSTN